jgi:hypothetical protein
VEIVEESAFRECDLLSEVVFGSGLKTIEDSAFSYCHKLNSVTLPEGLKTVGGRAFAFCDNLDTVYLPSTVESIFADALMQTHVIDVYVKAGSYADENFDKLTDPSYLNKIVE